MLNKSELQRMSPQDRARLAHDLVALDGPHLFTPVRVRGNWRRRLLISATLVCAVVLAAWTGYLAATLPDHYRAGGWSAAWVGFDAALLVMFAATAWAAWRRRQVLLLCLVVLATLLCCDAWFDTTLDWGTHGFMAAVTLALVAELPVAVTALVGVRRLLRLTIGRMEALEGNGRLVPPLWRVPLFGADSTASGYRDVFGQQYRALCQRPADGQAPGTRDAPDGAAARGLVAAAGPADPGDGPAAPGATP